MVQSPLVSLISKAVSRVLRAALLSLSALVLMLGNNEAFAASAGCDAVNAGQLNVTLFKKDSVTNQWWLNSSPLNIQTSPPTPSISAQFVSGDTLAYSYSGTAGSVARLVFTGAGSQNLVDSSFSGPVSSSNSSILAANFTKASIAFGTSTNVQFTIGAQITWTVTCTPAGATAPTITSISPNTSGLSGASNIVITGSGFTGASSVTFGANAATTYTVNSDTQITATAPAGSAGTVDVSVKTGAGTGTKTGGFTYGTPAPTVTSLSSTSGPATGGTSVTITGKGFTNASTVKFGTQNATSVTYTVPTSLTATAPPGSGTVDVTVTESGQTSATSANTKFTYVPRPTVTAISPSSGSAAGGTSVTITGTGFISGSRVFFGVTEATSVTYVSATELKATSPARTMQGGTGRANMLVYNGNQGSITNPDFTYLSDIAILVSLVPSSGTLSPSFDYSTTSYTASVANSVSSITLTPTVADTNSTVKVNGTTVASGSASGPINLSVGNNTITTVVTAQDGTTTKTYTLTVTRAAAANPLTITPTSSAVLAFGQNYSQTNVAAGGTAPYTYTLAFGTLPEGTSLNSTTGTVSGVLTRAGVFSYTIKVTDAASATATTSAISGAITSNQVGQVGDVSISLTKSVFIPYEDIGAFITFNDNRQDSNAGYYGFSISQNGTTTSFGNFDATTQCQNTVGGITFFGSNCASNTIKAPPNGGSFRLIFSATGLPGNINFDLRVAVLSITPTASVKTQVGQSYSQTNSAADGTGSYTYTLASGALPAGTSLDPTSGTVIGTPTTAGAFTYAIKVTDAASATATTTTISGTIAPAAGGLPVITSISPNSGGLSGRSGIVITGAGFTGVNAVLFGSNSATTYTFDSDTQITATAPPAGSAGTVDVIVSTSAGTGTKTGGFTYQSSLSSVATLASLVPSSGTLSPVFASATTNYTASVANSVSTITLTPTLADTNATVKVNGTTVSSGSASGPINLSVGSNTITTVVTAQDGTTTKTYTLTVTRAVATSTVATLSSLVPSSGTLSPAFASGTSSYTVSVANSVSSITLTPTVTDTNASVKVNGTTLSSGSASGPINLSVGTNTITIVVTAQDGTTTQTYTLTVTRAASGVATLTSLVPSSGTLSPAFASGTTSYAASVANSVSSISLTPTVSDANATVKVNGTTVTSGSASGSINLSVGTNTITTVVTAQDGTTTQTYTLTITRAAAATLTSISPASGLAGTSVTINGTNFSNASTVKFGTVVATVSFVSTTQLTAVAPSGTGTVNVIVSEGGVDATSANAQFTYLTASSVALTATPNPPVAGKPVTLRASVTPSTATGTITFKDGAQTLGIATLVNGVASFTTSLSLGAHVLTAAYTGDGSNQASVSPPLSLTPARPDPTSDQRVRMMMAAQQQHVSRLAQSVTMSVHRRLEDLHEPNIAPFRNGLALSGQNDTLSKDQQQIADLKALLEPPSGAPNLLAYAPPQGEMKMPRMQALDDKPARKPTDFGDSQIIPGFNVWTAGTITLGRQRLDDTPGTLRSQFYLVTLGMDRPVTESLKMGLSISLAREEGRLGDNSLRNDATSKVAVAYASWQAFDRVFIDGLLAYGDMRFETKRMDFNAATSLSGRRPANLFLASLAFSYDMRFEALRIAPFLRTDFLDAGLKSYTESGDANWALSFDTSRLASRSVALGVRSRYDIQYPGFVLSPTVRAEIRGGSQMGATQTLSYASDPSVTYGATVFGSSRYTASGTLGLLLDNRAGLTAEIETIGAYGGQRFSSGGLRGRLGWSF